jgi:hypothetical protein
MQAFAAIQLNQQLGISCKIYGIGAGVFFLVSRALGCWAAFHCSGCRTAELEVRGRSPRERGDGV